METEVAERYGDRAGEFLKFYPGDTDDQAARSAQREAVDRGFNLKLVEWLGIRGASKPVFAYLFTHVEPGPESARYGAFHTSEVPYEFNTLHLSPGRTFSDVDRRLAEQLSSYVANFVKNGDPNGGTLPRWPAMTAENKTLMDLGDHIVVSRATPAGADAVIAGGKPPAPAGSGRGTRGGGAPPPGANGRPAKRRISWRQGTSGSRRRPGASASPLWGCADGGEKAPLAAGATRGRQERTRGASERAERVSV